jgi:crotonobetainyl-CoA:carnitine CoA-transferase CaiB-like acyl-CoA transferase
MAEGPLDGVRILDLTDERAIYGGKLLADLGADVVRPEPPGGDALRRRGPRREAGGASLWYAFFASSRRFATIDLEAAAGRARLEELAARADVVLSCDGGFGLGGTRSPVLDLAAVRERSPAQVQVAVSSFGDDGPWRELMAPDLIAGALGGAVAATGTPETPPLKTFGELNFMVSGTYAAIAALAALNHARATGAGQRVAVSVHECIASCLEQVLMLNWYGPGMGRTRVQPRQGGTHWSMGLTVMQAKGGAIMASPLPDFDAQLAWLVEEDAHQDLLDEKYSGPENLPLYLPRLMQVMRDWVAVQDPEELFFRAQARHSPYGWVLPIERLADNPQLAARGWWTEFSIDGASVRGPGAPYRFSATPWRNLAPGTVGAGTLQDDLSWNTPLRATSRSRPDPEQGSVVPGSRPLDGVRVLDFTHVLAGPYATRILADMGADVVKVNSMERALAGNGPDSPYYVMWNRNKRALALDMRNPEGRALCRRLCDVADVVIENFAVGVLDRWGIAYAPVSGTNPGVIYVQMSGMGHGGPWSGFVTYAPTIHALSGLTLLTSVPGREDIGIGYSYNDHQAGLHGTVAILAALEARRRTGRGQQVDLSQFEVGVNFLGPSLLDWFANGRAARATGNRLPYDDAAPHGVYPCRPQGEGVIGERWIAIACMDDAHWRALRVLLGEPAWAADPGLDTGRGRVAAAARLDERIAAWTRDADAVELMTRCQAAGVPAGVVQDGIDLAERDPQLQHTGFIRPIGEPGLPLGDQWAERLPLRFEHTPCDEYHRTRLLGEDNAAVLADWLGMSPAEVALHEANGVLR